MIALRHLILTILLVCASVYCAYGLQPPNLRSVQKIYVDSFGNAEGAGLIREKLINRLVQSGKVTVVESPEQADAILVGVGEVTRGVRYTSTQTESGGSASGGTKYDATLVVRLISREKAILWVDEAKPGLMARSVSSSVADKIVKNLLKSIDKAQKSK